MNDTISRCEQVFKRYRCVEHGKNRKKKLKKKIGKETQNKKGLLISIYILSTFCIVMLQLASSHFLPFLIVKSINHKFNFFPFSAKPSIKGFQSLTNVIAMFFLIKQINFAISPNSVNFTLVKLTTLIKEKFLSNFVSSWKPFLDYLLETENSETLIFELVDQNSL